MEIFEKSKVWLSQLSSEAKFFHEKKASSLSSVKKILESLGNPDEFFEWRVVVGGTAGKGTVCRLTEDILLRSGKSVATIMSPHLQVVTERIRINGKLISAKNFGKSILKIKEISQETKIALTYYEVIVLAGIYAAKESNCEILIAEVGLGGEFDAVNVIKGKRISVLTFVGKDHMEILGNLESIAKTKSGIFTKETVLALSGERTLRNIIIENSAVEVEFVKGIQQKLSKKISRKICKKILGISDFQFQKLKIPARWEKIENIILDGAHSEPRFEFILPKIKKISGKKIGIFGMLKDHDANVFQKIITEFDEIFWVDDFVNDRICWSSEELMKNMKKGRSDYSKTSEALAYIKKNNLESTILVLGSFYLCGTVRNYFYSSEYILESQKEY